MHPCFCLHLLLDGNGNMILYGIKISRQYWEIVINASSNQSQSGGTVVTTPGQSNGGSSGNGSQSSAAVAKWQDSINTVDATLRTAPKQVSVRLVEPALTKPDILAFFTAINIRTEGFDIFEFLEVDYSQFKETLREQLKRYNRVISMEIIVQSVLLSVKIENRDQFYVYIQLLYRLEPIFPNIAQTVIIKMLTQGT